MSWNDLSMREKAALIKIGVLNKISDIKLIRNAYNSFDEGGDINQRRIAEKFVKDFTTPITNQLSPYLLAVSNAMTERHLILNDMMETFEIENPERKEFWSPVNRWHKYPDPSNKGYDVGPGLLVGKAIPDLESYSNEDIENAFTKYWKATKQGILNHIPKGRLADWDKTSPKLKYLMRDVLYQSGIYSKHPKLMKAILNNDTIKALIESRNTFTDENAQGNPLRWDNGRVERNSNLLFPGQFNIIHKGNTSPFLKVERSMK